MKLLIVALLAAGCSTLGWQATQAIFAQPVFARRNYRGADVPVGVGVVLVVAMVAVEAGLAVADTIAEPAAGERTGRLLALVLAIGFGLLGFIDDLAAAGDDRGFGGHLRAMVRGRLTTGGLKLAGGGLLAFVVVAALGEDRLWVLAVDALLIALSANVANLFDRAPGRTTKVGLVAALTVVVAATGTEHHLLLGVAAMAGAAAGLLVFDLREDLMLGDAGSNVIGAVVGLGVVLSTAPSTRIVVLLAVAGLNLASERVSFSRVIDATTPLRILDRAGRRRMEVPDHP